MIKDTVRVTCGSCGAHYNVRVTWLETASEYDCSCGARLMADLEDLFQIRYQMMALPEVTLHPLHEHARPIG
jgi:hypothetical protein